SPPLRELLRERRTHECVAETKPAVFIRYAQTPHAERADFLMKVPCNYACLVPFRRERRHFRGNEAPDGFAESAALFGFERVFHLPDPLAGPRLSRGEIDS